jgi:hypothetical protein
VQKIVSNEAPPHSDSHDDTIAQARFRATSRRYQRLTTAAIGLVLLLVAMYGFMVSHALATGAALPLGWIVNWLPAAFYLWAMLQLRALFAALGGDAPANATAGVAVAVVVGRVGWALMLGAAATLVPLFNLFANLATRGGTLVAYLVPAVTLFAIGLALVALAPMLTRAIALEAKTAALKAELDEFF